MKIAVLGGGVIGVTSAWYLLQAGHEVVVIDRQQGPALETSFANAGEISPGYASPWAAPGVPAKIVKWLLMRHSPLIIRLRADPAMMRWLMAALRQCSSSRYAQNKGRMMRLAEFSREQLGGLRKETGITYDERALGTLQLFREERQLEGIAKDLVLLEQEGVRFQLLDRRGCVAAEPGLGHSGAKIAGGLRLPLDETGDCFKFTNALAELATRDGVRFLFGQTVQRLEARWGRITAAITNRERIEADQFLVAMGSYSPGMVRSLGLKVPIYPVKGYSITVPVACGEGAPVSTLLDETYKVAITRLGDRIRVGGMAELSGFSRDLPIARRATLEQSVSSLFPGAGRMEEATFWSGLRPMTPDGAPIIGPTSISNLYLNTGHGTLGWTMACGSAHVICDQMSGRTPRIQAADLALSRYCD